MKLEAGTPHPDAIDEASAWCLRLADDSLSAQDRSEFAAWLTEPRNAQALEDVTRTWQAIEATSVAPDLVDMRRDALAVFQRAHLSRWRGGASRWRGVAALAACLLIMCVAAVMWAQLTPTRYSTGLAERRIVALPDGSKMSLDAQTTVEARYTRQRRELWLKHGRAKFDVAHDSLRPFSVNAADKLVVATGTKFSVELLVRQVHVILYQGSVDVLADHEGTAPKPVQVISAPTSAAGRLEPSLVPGRELIAPFDAAVAHIDVADPVGSAAWEAGQLVFRDEPLASAVERLNRYAAVPLEIGDDRAGATLISGVYAAGDAQAFIEGVTAVFPIQVREIGGRQQLFTRR